MGYPISNLKKDFEDININNREAIKEYSEALEKAINTGDFTEASNVYNKYKDTLNNVIINAETINNLTNYVEDLRKYTIESKNQLFFVSENYKESDSFAELDENLSEGDVLVVTDNSSRHVVKSFKEKLNDGNYGTVGTITSNKKYAECNSENIDPTGIAHITIDNSDISWDNGDIFITFNSTYSSTKFSDNLRLEINDHMQLEVICKGEKVSWKEIKQGCTYHFVYVISHDTGQPMLELINLESDSDTGWITLELTDFFESYVDGTPLQIRKIGKIVHMRGIIKPIIPNGFTEPFLVTTISEKFRPSIMENCVQQGSGVSRFMMQIKSSGEIEISRYSKDNGTTAVTPPAGAWLNCYATWFVD